MARSIEGMSAASSETRVIAATEIYRKGRALAEHAVYPWWADEELKELLEGPEGVITVGLAVLPATFERIREANGSPKLAEVPPDQDAKEFEIHMPGGLNMDVLTTRDEAGNGAIAKYLQKFGEGIQQVELRCKNVDRATQIVSETFGVKPVYPTARPGADGTRVNFFLVSAPGESKVLIEFYEPAVEME